MAATTYGVTSVGFVGKSQQQIITELRTSLQGIFGANINLTPQGPLGQMMYIFSEREAILWQLAEAVYSSQYPSGAQGVSVDNILALNNIKRIGNVATKTANTSSTGVNGLILYGLSGTIVSSGSLISVAGSPTIQFSLDSTTRIGDPANASQFIAFSGGPPTVGTWTLAILDYLGNTKTTATLNWNSTADDVKDYIHALVDGAIKPFTDVVVTGSFASGGFTVDFGSATPESGQPSSGEQVQNLFTLPTNTMLNSTTVVNSYVSTIVVGHPAQAIGSATCTVPGPTVVTAGQLSVIGTPTSGWASVTNPLDCVTGSNVESDPVALMRRNTLLSSASNGPLESIVNRVTQITGVVSCVGYENVSMAAWQYIAFSGGTATGGSYKLTFVPQIGSTIQTAAIPFNAIDTTQRIVFTYSTGDAPTGGSFTITSNGHTTTALDKYATAITVQSALRLLPGCETVVVTGSYAHALGFYVAFGTATQYSLTTANSLTGVSGIVVTPSIQSVVNGTAGYDGAKISGSLANGLQVIFDGSSGAEAQGVITIYATTLTGAIITATSVQTIPPKSFEIVINDGNHAIDADIANAIFGSKPAGIQAYGTTTHTVTDSSNNDHVIGFTRATPVNIYVSLSLNTDLLLSTPQFVVSSILQIQQDIIDIGNAVGIGNLIISFGTNGLIGAFNNVPGIMSYTLYFGRTASPTMNTNIQMNITEVPQFTSLNVLVSYV